MKRLILVVSIGIFMGGCASEPATNMVVTGQVKGLKKGTLYLQKITDSKLVALDSTTVDENGYYTLNGQVDSPELYYLYLTKEDHNDINDRIVFFGEPGTITINTKWDTFDAHPDISGSPTTEKLLEYRKTMSRFHARELEIAQMGTRDSIPLDSLQKLIDSNTKRQYAFALNYALNHVNSTIAPYIAVYEVPESNPVYLDSIYKSLTPEIVTSTYGMELKKLIGELTDQ
ncbi:MAG: DUF4369 domain-containing protein [Flavobacteriaceae bacterium]